MRAGGGRQGSGQNGVKGGEQVKKTKKNPKRMFLPLTPKYVSGGRLQPAGWRAAKRAKAARYRRINE